VAGGELYSEIHAGGSGTRLWPLSRAGHPKFLHALTGSPSSLLQATMARLTPLSPLRRIFVVTGVAHAAAVARQLPDLPETNLLVEPSPRDSCAAIGLAAAVIARQDADAVMGSFAADHLVQDQAGFERVIRHAVTGAEDGLLMTIGITPTHPETGYGYVRWGDGHRTVRSVREFKEKPSVDVAQAYLDSGEYLWNAGMFVWRARTFLSELERQQPAMYEGLSVIAEAWGTPHQDRVLGEVWPLLPKISVDHAVMEGAADAGMVGTVPGDFGWTDVGDFDTLGTVLSNGAAGVDRNVVINDAGVAPVLLETENSVVITHSRRLVALLGVRDVVVVDTNDAVLVCGRDRAQKLKSVVDELKSRGDGQYL
jgi:mannose-1-phosphate guanylyltransferase